MRSIVSPLGGIRSPFGVRRASGAPPTGPAITSSDGDPASLVDNGNGTYSVVINGTTVGTITQAQINAGGFITVVEPVVGMSGNNVVLNTTGYVIYVGSTPIETDVEVLANSIVVGNALPFDATAYPTEGLQVRFSYSVGVANLSILKDARTFTPAVLFASSEQGFWFDPSDLSSMFQDTAGTIPVTAAGQQVARINDKSGRGNYATQATAANRPILRQDAGGRYYLEFNGTSHFLQLTSRLWAAGSATLIAAYQAPPQTDRRLYAEGRTTTGEPIYALMQSGNAAGIDDNLQVFIRNDASSAVSFPAPGGPNVDQAFNNTRRVARVLDSGSTVLAAVDRGTVTGGGAYTRTTLTVNIAAIGCLLRTTAGSFFQHNLYGIVGRGAVSSAGEIAATEAFLAAQAGVTLP